MSMNDEEYFYSRAEMELRMAQAAKSPEAVRAHYTLAGHYLDRAYGGGADHPSSVEAIRSRLPLRTGEH